MQASHCITDCLGMEVYKLEMQYSLLLCTSLGNQNARKVREKVSVLVNFTETKSNFALDPLISLLGLCT